MSIRLRTIRRALRVVAGVAGLLLGAGPTAIRADDDPLRTAERLKTLAEERGEEAVPELTRRLDDPSPVIRYQAADLLAEIDGPTVERLFLDRMTSDSSEVRRVAVSALGRCALGRPALDAVRKAARDPHPMVRWAAVLALGQLADRESEPLLREIAENDPHRTQGGSYPVREAAREVLAKMPTAVRWYRDLSAAFEAAAETNRPVFIFFDARNEDWSKRMKVVLELPSVGRALQPWVCARIRVDLRPQMMEDFDVRGTPTVVLMTADGREIERWIGYRSARDVLDGLFSVAFGKAASSVRRQAESEQEDPASQWRAAETYMSEEREDRALPLLRRIIESDPENRAGYTDDALFAIGYCCGRMGQHRDSIVALESLIREYPDFPRIGEAWFCLGLSRLSLGDVSGAEEALKRASNSSNEITARKARRVLGDLRSALAAQSEEK